MREYDCITEHDLESAKSKFCEWRKTKKYPSEPIPAHLWKIAQELTKYHSINKVAKALSLGYSDLKHRLRKHEVVETVTSPIPFIELENQYSFTQSECIIEMEDRFGAKMKMCFRGKTDLDLLEMGKTFWRQGA